jgi:hypothetical protein
MKYIKFLLINVIVFGGLLTLISFLFPSEINTSKTININGSTNKILLAIENIKDSSWTMFSPADTILTISDHGNTLKQWNFSRNKKITCKLLVYKNDGDSTPVNFTVIEKLKWYPWEKFGALVAGKNISNAIEASLNRLKKQIEIVK